MREHGRNIGRTDRFIQPRYAVYENVPGVYSSNKGADFAACLTALIRIAEPQAPNVPVPDKGWPANGYLYDEMGGWSVAWHTHDAQYHGVAQRRKRVCILADFCGLSAGAIMFDPQLLRKTKGADGVETFTDFGGRRSEVQPLGKSVSGHTEQSGEEREEAPGTSASSTDGTSCTLKIRGGAERDSNGRAAGKGALIQNELSATLGVSQDQTLFCLEGNGSRDSHKGDGFKESETSYTLNTVEQHAVAYGLDSYNQTAEEETAQPIRSSSGGDCAPKVATAYNIGAYDSNAWKSKNPDSGVYEAEQSKSLDAMNCGYPACNQGGTAIIQPTMIEMTSTKNTVVDDGISPTLTARMGTGGNQVNAVQCMDVGWFDIQEDKSPSLLARQYKDPPCIGIDRSAFNQGMNAQFKPAFDENLSAAIAERGPNAVCTAVDCHNGTEDEVNGTLQSTACHNTNSNNVSRAGSVVRRLTPGECESLQGFPKNWTDIGDWVDTKGKTHKAADSPRYKALGNSIAVGFDNERRGWWMWLMKRISAQYERRATLGSLFDGIGGFPLAWESINGKGSARWASEIEEFPIAVTKIRFPEE